MKIGTIVKNIVYRPFASFSYRVAFFECSIVRRPLLGTMPFCIYGVKPRSIGPFTVPKNMPFFIDFDSCLHAL